mgnify:CR=1 FL=1
MESRILGIHHITAIAGDAQRNYDFYTKVLGLRLVKKTVNQDDVSAYHLFYADAIGSPGTDLTFFDWPVPQEVRGSRSIASRFPSLRLVSRRPPGAARSATRFPSLRRVSRRAPRAAGSVAS